MSLDERGNPRFLKVRVTPNIKQASVKKFAHAAIADASVIYSDGYRSYIPALEGYIHEHRSYEPNSGLLHWLHIVVSNAKTFILGTYHGLPRNTFNPIWTSILFVSAVATSVALCWIVWSWL